MAEALRVDGLVAGHGSAVVIRDLSLALAPGEALAVLGRNGAGKTTLVDSIIGVTRRSAGRIILDGVDVTALSPDARARAGMGWVPQDRGIFRSLTVRENLTVAARPGPWTLAAVQALFPPLAERRALMGRQLSGGEQQMLAIGRALMTNPRVLLLDEPTEGLAPIVMRDLLAAIQAITRQGVATVIVEQHARQVLGITDRAVILDRGRVVHEGFSRDLLADPATIAAHLGAGLAPVDPAAQGPPDR